MHTLEYFRLAALERTHWWYTGMAAIANDWLRTVPRTGGRAEVLDVGCGSGGALEWLADFGRVWGVDRNAWAARLASGRQLARGDVTALPFRDGQFEILTAFDVLYHRDVPDDGDVTSLFRATCGVSLGDRERTQNERQAVYHGRQDSDLTSGGQWPSGLGCLSRT